MNNSKKSLMAELETNFYINYILEHYNVQKDVIVKQYQKKRRFQNIGSYALDYLDNFLAKNHDFLARIDFLYRTKQGNAAIGEIMYCKTEKEYKNELDNCDYYGIPAEFKVIKNKEKDLGIQRERTL